MDLEKERDGCRISDMTWFFKRHTRPYVRRSENWTIERENHLKRKRTSYAPKNWLSAERCAQKGAFRVKLKFSLLLLLLFSTFFFYCCTFSLYTEHKSGNSQQKCVTFSRLLQRRMTRTRPRETGQKLRLIKCERFNDGISAFAHLKNKKVEFMTTENGKIDRGSCQSNRLLKIGQSTKRVGIIRLTRKSR